MVADLIIAAIEFLFTYKGKGWVGTVRTWWLRCLAAICSLWAVLAVVLAVLQPGWQSPFDSQGGLAFAMIMLILLVSLPATLFLIPAGIADARASGKRGGRRQ